MNTLADTLLNAFLESNNIRIKELLEHGIDGHIDDYVSLNTIEEWFDKNYHYYNVARIVVDLLSDDARDQFAVYCCISNFNLTDFIPKSIAKDKQLLIDWFNDILTKITDHETYIADIVHTRIVGYYIRNDDTDGINEMMSYGLLDDDYVFDHEHYINYAICNGSYKSVKYFLNLHEMTITTDIILNAIRAEFNYRFLNEEGMKKIFDEYIGDSFTDSDYKNMSLLPVSFIVKYYFDDFAKIYTEMVKMNVCDFFHYSYPNMYTRNIDRSNIIQNGAFKFVEKLSKNVHNVDIIIKCEE